MQFSGATGCTEPRTDKRVKKFRFRGVYVIYSGKIDNEAQRKWLELYNEPEQKLTLVLIPRSNSMFEVFRGNNFEVT